MQLMWQVCSLQNIWWLESANKLNARSSTLLQFEVYFLFWSVGTYHC